VNADEREYLARREREETTAAATCKDNAAAKAHLEMAAMYRKRLERLKEPRGLIRQDQ